jgi:hypothetical protein
MREGSKLDLTPILVQFTNPFLRNAKPLQTARHDVILSLPHLQNVSIFQDPSFAFGS